MLICKLASYHSSVNYQFVHILYVEEELVPPLHAWREGEEESILPLQGEAEEESVPLHQGKESVLPTHW